MKTSDEQKRAHVLKRDGDECAVRTSPRCEGVATTVMVEPGWRPFGVDGAPAYAIHACCDACAERWAV